MNFCETPKYSRMLACFMPGKQLPFSRALHFALVNARPDWLPPVSEDFLLTASIGCSLVGVPFVWVLTMAKADGMANYWRVPKSTFILSRPLARYLLSAVAGVAIGGTLVAPFVDWPLLPMIASHALMAVGMLVGCDGDSLPTHAPNGRCRLRVINSFCRFSELRDRTNDASFPDVIWEAIFGWRTDDAFAQFK